MVTSYLNFQGTNWAIMSFSTREEIEIFKQNSKIISMLTRDKSLCLQFIMMLSFEVPMFATGDLKQSVYVSIIYLELRSNMRYKFLIRAITDYTSYFLPGTFCFQVFRKQVDVIDIMVSFMSSGNKQVCLRKFLAKFGFDLQKRHKYVVPILARINIKPGDLLFNYQLLGNLLCLGVPRHPGISVVDRSFIEDYVSFNFLELYYYNCQDKTELENLIFQRVNKTFAVNVKPNENFRVVNIKKDKSIESDRKAKEVEWVLWDINGKEQKFETVQSNSPGESKFNSDIVEVCDFVVDFYRVKWSIRVSVLKSSGKVITRSKLRNLCYSRPLLKERITKLRSTFGLVIVGSEPRYASFVLRGKWYPTSVVRFIFEKKLPGMINRALDKFILESPERIEDF